MRRELRAVDPSLTHDSFWASLMFAFLAFVTQILIFLKMSKGCCQKLCSCDKLFIINSSFLREEKNPTLCFAFLKKASTE